MLTGTRGVILWTRDNDAVIAGKPPSYAVDDTVPPATGQLRDHLDRITLAEAEACPIVGIVVVERSNVHTSGRCGTWLTIHTRRLRTLP